MTFHRDTDSSSHGPGVGSRLMHCACGRPYSDSDSDDSDRTVGCGATDGDGLRPSHGRTRNLNDPASFTRSNLPAEIVRRSPSDSDRDLGRLGAGPGPGQSPPFTVASDSMADLARASVWPGAHGPADCSVCQTTPNRTRSSLSAVTRPVPARNNGPGVDQNETKHGL